MSDTPPSTCGWSIETLLQHLDRILVERDRRYEQRFQAQEHAIAAALASQEKAVAAALTAAKEAGQKAEQSATQRLDAHNELQNKLDRQASTLAGKDWVDGRMAILERDLRAVNARLDRSEGRGTGLHAGWGYLAGGVALLATIISIYLAISR